ncbi:MAG TPA: FecR domain-containing protein [Povalibacter sp.]|nr:FecR domain-containing protein [Povalibacter sp.]
MEPLGAGTLMEIRKEASAWLIEMDVDPKRWNRKRFTAWLKLSPQHMEEFLAQSALWGALIDLGPGGIDLGNLPKGPDNVIELPRTSQVQSQSVRGWFRWWFVGLAAALMLIVSTTVFWGLRLDDGEILATAIGEQRAVRLDDGSVVHLNTDTRVRIHFTQSAREIQLIQGEALFTVKRDVNRPFRVQSDGIRVEALGTQFNVRRRNNDTVVSVVEGRVAVVDPSRVAANVESSSRLATDQATGSNRIGAPAEQDGAESGVSPQKAPGVAANVPYEAGRPAPAGALAVLAAGEQVSVAVDGTLDQPPAQNVSAATAWRQRQLVFSNTPLIDVAAEVARYNVAPRLQIEGAALQGRRLNGVFAADDPESLIQFLARDPALLVTRSGDIVVIRFRDREPAVAPINTVSLEDKKSG